MTNFKEKITFYKEDNYVCLDLSRQKLTSIPKDIKDIPQFMLSEYGDEPYKEINLSYNNIEDLNDEDFEILNGFDIIHLVALKMKKLPTSIKKLTNPIVLNFSYSTLVELPQEIYNLKQLASIRINWTSIKNFHRDIKNLENLVEVEVAETPFLETIYEIKDNGGETADDLENKVWEIKQILDEMECEIIE